MDYKMIRIVCAGLLVLLSFCVRAGDDIPALNRQVTLPTQVMVLGTMHLADIDTPLNAAHLSPLLDALETYRPTAIGVESLRPEDILAMVNASSDYQAVLDFAVGAQLQQLAKQEQQSLGMSAQQAITEARHLLSRSVQDNPQRLTLVRLAIAGYNKTLATLHWHKLPQAERDKAPSALQAYLDKAILSNNENNVLANALALRLGHNRLYQIDDHMDKDLYPPIAEALMPSFKASKYAGQIPQSEYISKPQRMKAQAAETGDWLPLYRWINGPQYSSEVIHQDWSLFVNKDLAPEPALARMALWQVRNLNMVSHIMRVVADNVGGRVLIIVGANHKVFFEQYLSNMIGVELVQFNDYASNPDSQ
ncbi:DUF5694 domain-containing protein [Shewanella sp. GXUN23E]|uniref:DUF5694 domain-containing protein n=1 Tax=Shewanella sp. GXUN23E TaxID=3422498 RepID=UPI003D7D588F